MKFSILALMAAAFTSVNANTAIDAVTMQTYLNDKGGFGLAMAARPMWHFARMRPAFFFKQYPMCYPSAALVDGKQHGTNPNKWPDAATGCADPGPRGSGNPFPTYYTVTKCSADEIRVTYSLYFQHDGFSNALIAKGHMHDWERIIVIWRWDVVTNSWTRSKLLMSMHSGYTEKSWGSITHTFNFDNTPENNGKNKDAPKIFVGWAKHPNFDKKETGWRDRISQGCQREYRDGDWWYLPEAKDLVWAANGSPEGESMKKFNWGGTTGPWVVEEGVCKVQKGGFTSC